MLSLWANPHQSDIQSPQGSAGRTTVLESRTCVLYINLIIFWDDVFSGAQHRIASGLFKDINSAASVSQPDFLPRPVNIDDSTSAFWVSATSVIWFQVIEGFLSKEVSYIVSSRREAKAESSRTSHRGCPSPSEVTVDTPPVANPKGSRARPAQKAMDPVRTSWGGKCVSSKRRK